MELSGKLHAPAASPQVKSPQYQFDDKRSKASRRESVGGLR